MTTQLRLDFEARSRCTVTPRNAPTTSGLAPLTVTVTTALRLTGLGRTKLYELIAERKVETVKVGRRRLVSVASIKRLLAINSV